MAEPLLYTFHLLGLALTARSVRGREALSEPFRLEVFLHLDDGVTVDPDAAVREVATLALARSSVERQIAGVVTEIAVGEIAAESETGARTLHVVIEPAFALARLKKNTKAFVHKSVVDIVTEVLSELGVSHSLRLGGGYPVRPYTVQFGETDFHFVSRMLEEEGIFYFFAEDGAMILADGKGGYDAAGALPFRHAAGTDEHGDAILGMGARGSATASKVTLRDWTPDGPSRPMDVTASGPRASGPEHYDFPGEYVEPGHGQRIANRMAGALACLARRYGGRASAARLAPGRTFDLWSAPAGLSDGQYVITTVEHDYERTREGFSVRFEALDGDMDYRAPIRHEEPILPNPVIGEVVGPPGSDIHTDELGRVKVHFRWDRLQPKDDTCSHWFPVLQDNLAHSVGIPRVGWEVVVHFLEGDPDRPVVLGRVYNGEDRFHMSLPDKKTITALRSLSSPTRDGQNFVELEDMQGRENINIHAEKNQDVVVVNDKTERVMAVETHEIDHDETIAIGNDEKIAVTENDATPVVDGNRTVEIGGDRTREIGSDDAFNVGGDRTLSIGGSHKRKIAATSGRWLAACAVLAATAAACGGRPGDIVYGAAPARVSVGPVPGPGPDLLSPNPFAGDRAAAGAGRRLFTQFNCAGCHGEHGGGGMGPSLRDQDWIFGSADGQIFSSIHDGRGHGMPSWQTRLEPEQIWRLVSYITSLRTRNEVEPPQE